MGLALRDANGIACYSLLSSKKLQLSVPTIRLGGYETPSNPLKPPIRLSSRKGSIRSNKYLS